LFDVDDDDVPDETPPFDDDDGEPLKLFPFVCDAVTYCVDV
jgi:hypothetical protein